MSKGGLRSLSMPKKNKTEELNKSNSLKGSKVAKICEPNTNKPSKPNVSKRKSAIYEALNDILNNLHLDPILETFRTNEPLKEFFLKRVLELIAVFECLNI
jgi:hypothetical protein